MTLVPEEVVGSVETVRLISGVLSFIRETRFVGAVVFLFLRVSVLN